MSCFNRINTIFLRNIKVVLTNGVIVRRTFSLKTATSTTTNNSDHDGPIQVLQKKIQANELQIDEHQGKVMIALQHLYETLQTYRPEPPQEKSLFSWLTLGKSKNSNEIITKAPKGLYIHGSVGGGKTTLMDLFYNCCHSVRRMKEFHTKNPSVSSNPVSFISD